MPKVTQLVGMELEFEPRQSDTTACARNHFSTWPPKECQVTLSKELPTPPPKKSAMQGRYKGSDPNASPAPEPWHMLFPRPETPCSTPLPRSSSVHPLDLNIQKVSLPKGHFLCSPQTIQIHLQTLAA